MVGFDREFYPDGTASASRNSNCGATTPRWSLCFTLEDGSGPVEPPYTNEFGVAASRYTLTPKLWAYLQNYKIKHRTAGNGFGFGLVGRNDVARTLSARYYKDGSEILVDRDQGRPRGG